MHARCLLINQNGERGRRKSLSGRLQQTWDSVTSRLGTHYGKRFYSICPHTYTTFPTGSRSLSSMRQSLFKFKIDSLLIFKDHWWWYWEWNFRGIPVSNNLLGNTVGRRLLPSETVVHDRRLLECKIWYDSCLMSSIKHLPSYHSLYCFRVDTTSKFLRKQDLWTKVELRSSKRGRGKLVANVQWVSSLLFLFISTLNNRVRHLIPFGNQKTQKKAPFSTMFKIPTKKRCGKWKVLVLMPFWEVLYSSCRIIFCVCKWGTRT